MSGMATIPEALAIAVQHHQSGRLQAAEQIYRKILAVEPEHADSLHLLGLIAFQVGKHELAVEYIRQAIRLQGGVALYHTSLGNALKEQGKLSEAVACHRRALQRNPNYAEAHNNLGNALSALGKLDEAVACYRRAMKLKSDFAAPHYNLGALLGQQGKLDEAVACYRRALARKADYVEAHNNLGGIFRDQGKLEEAIACWRRVLELRPDVAQAHCNLGAALKDQEKLDEAAACCRRALELRPDFAEAHNNLGSIYQEQGKLDEALACFRRALELRPAYAEAHSNLGNTLTSQGKLDEAVACCRRALELNPDYAQAYSNLANALKDQGQRDEALACCRRALELKPDLAEAHLNRSVLLLAGGDFAQGWPEYEWRWQTKGVASRRFPQPLWDGGPLAGKTLLLHAEQGLGDTIQFVRYASVARQLAAAVVVECQKPLLGLLQGCPGIDRLVGQGDDLPAFDAHAPLMSVPGLLKTGLETIPAPIPYVFPSPALLEHWRQRLSQLDGFKIGIAWQGNPKHRSDRLRSTALRCFAPLAEISAVCLISLQKGAGSEQLAEVRDLFAVTDLADELDQQSGPFMDTAAVMKNVDLVIAADTAAAHLAGALGVPVWVALPFAPDWRWLLDRSDSPWYPTMRLFRQKSLGDWAGVFAEMQSALRERLA